MSTTPVSSSSIYQELQSFYQSRGADLKALGDALQSGDLAAAQSEYSQLAALGQSGPYGNAEPFSRSDRAQDFEAIGQALQSGDLAGAQAAFAQLQGTFSHQLAKHVNYVPTDVVNLNSGDGTSSSEASSTESIYQQLHDFRVERKADLKQLSEALSSGDLNAAQQAYDTLVQLGEQGPFANAEPFHRADRAQAFEAIGQALQTGDLAGAQQAFAALESTFGRQAHGGPLPPVYQGGGFTQPPIPPRLIGPPVHRGGFTSPPLPPGQTEPPVYGGGTTNPPIPPEPVEPPVYGGGGTANPPLPPSTEPPVYGGGTTNPPLQQGPVGPPVYGGNGTTLAGVSEIVLKEKIVLNLFGESSASQSSQGSGLNVQG